MKFGSIDKRVFGEVCDEVTRFVGSAPRDPRFRLRRFEVGCLQSLIPKGGKLLDVGCGAGLVPRYFHRLGYQVVSVDYPATGGMSALKSLIDFGIEGHYTRVGFDPLPLANGSMDVVFAGNVIEHLPNSPRVFLDDLKRVLKPGGYLVVDTKNAVDIKTRLKVLAGISNWAPLDSFFDMDIHPHHHKEYTLGELMEALRRSGFTGVEGIAFECFLNLSLKRFKTFQAMGKMSKDVSQFGQGFNPFHPYEYFRLFMLGAAALAPSFRSDILAFGRK